MEAGNLSQICLERKPGWSTKREAQILSRKSNLMIERDSTFEDCYV